MCVNMIINQMCVNTFSPWRIVDDCGGAFSMGAIGGAFFHSIKGYRNAPSVSMLRGCFYHLLCVCVCLSLCVSGLCAFMLYVLNLDNICKEHVTCKALKAWAD